MPLFAEIAFGEVFVLALIGLGIFWVAQDYAREKAEKARKAELEEENARLRAMMSQSPPSK